MQSADNDSTRFSHGFREIWYQDFIFELNFPPERLNLVEQRSENDIFFRCKNISSDGFFSFFIITFCIGLRERRKSM